MSVDFSRPGSDPLRPHQDLRIPSRIPSQYLSQVLPASSSGSSSFSTPPVAVQIASLHRAAEVARFEWRAAQRARQAANRDSHTTSTTTATAETRSEPAQLLPRSSALSSQRNAAASSSSLEAAQARDARMSSQIYASASDAYDAAVRDLNRHTGAGLLDVSDGEVDDGNAEADLASETSGDSTNTENEVVAATMAAPWHRRSVEMGNRRSTYSARQSRTSSASTGLWREDNIIAESQVWDRMVNDLAIGAGVSAASASSNYPIPNESGPFAQQRGVSGGIAASMLALSAAIPRPDTQWSSSDSHGGTAPPRLLPHPIWARRYPGAAGEWLRGELARRASGSSTQSFSSQPSTSIPRPATLVPRLRSSSTAQWEDGSANPAFPTTQIHSGVTDNPFHDLFSDRNRGSGARRTSNWDWNVLRFPSLDPASRERRSRSEQVPSASVLGTDATTSVAIASTNTLAVPADSRALVPTPPLAELNAARDRRTSRPVQEERTVDRSSEILQADAANESTRRSAVNSDAADLVARMAQASREMAAARSDDVQQTVEGTNSEGPTLDGINSRATQGGLSYIRRLRQLDGLEPPSEQPQSNIADSEEESSEPSSPLRLYEVFPWYQPPQIALDAESSYNDEIEGCSSNNNEFDPDGSNLTWYEMARDRMASQSSVDVPEVNEDPDGDRLVEEGELGSQTIGVRRRVLTGSGATGASQRAHRHRSALVVAEERPDNNNHNQRDMRIDPWNAMDSWTLVDQRPMSPVRRSRDEGSENVTTWLREPAHPTGRFSTSPLPMNSSILPSRPATTRTIHSYRPVPASEDPRTTRRPRRLASLAYEELEVRDNREDTPSPELLPTETGSNYNSTQRMSGWEQGILGRARQLTSIGRRLEEEFRARQGELRQREERLRSEVARRRMELDQVRRRQGRIGRVVDQSRHHSTDAQQDTLATSDTNNEILSEDTFDALAEALPLLGEQESSLIRRSALREPRRSVVEAVPEVEDSIALPVRNAPPTPLQEILARISLNSSRMHSGSERSVRRSSSWSVPGSDSLSQALQVTSLDDHHH